MKPTRSACALEPLEPVHRQPRHGDAMRQDSANRVGMQRGLADPIAGADFSKQRPGFAFGHRLPGLERPHRAGFHKSPARQADLRPLPRLVGLSPADAQPQPAGDDGDVLDAERDQFGAAQRADEAEQQQRAVAPAAGALIAGEQESGAALSGSGPRPCAPAGHACAARPAAGPGCRDAPGSTANR